MSSIDAPGPLWSGHKPSQLYVVTQSPRDKFRHMVGLVWFTHATSKTAAIRAYMTQCPQADNYLEAAYKKPEACLVMTGGDALRV